MQPSEHANGRRAAQHTAKSPVAAVLGRPQAIAVLDARVPAGQRSRPRTEPIVQSHLIAKECPSPAIVIARDHEDGDPGFTELR